MAGDAFSDFTVIEVIEPKQGSEPADEAARRRWVESSGRSERYLPVSFPVTVGKKDHHHV